MEKRAPLLRPEGAEVIAGAGNLSGLSERPSPNKTWMRLATLEEIHFDGLTRFGHGVSVTPKNFNVNIFCLNPSIPPTPSQLVQLGPSTADMTRDLEDLFGHAVVLTVRRELSCRIHMLFFSTSDWYK
jgi:hypothetical protein